MVNQINEVFLPLANTILGCLLPVIGKVIQYFGKEFFHYLKKRNANYDHENKLLLSSRELKDCPKSIIGNKEKDDAVEFIQYDYYAGIDRITNEQTEKYVHVDSKISRFVLIAKWAYFVSFIVNILILILLLLHTNIHIEYIIRIIISVICLLSSFLYSTGSVIQSIYHYKSLANQQKAFDAWDQELYKSISVINSKKFEMDLCKLI